METAYIQIKKSSNWTIRVHYGMKRELNQILNGKSKKPNTIKVQPHEKDTTKEEATEPNENIA